MRRTRCHEWLPSRAEDEPAPVDWQIVLPGVHELAYERSPDLMAWLVVPAALLGPPCRHPGMRRREAGA
jgi:hypothetical protein